MLSSNSRSCNYNHNPFSENDISSFTSKSEDPNPNNFFLGGFPNSPPHMHLEYQDDVVVYLLDHVLNSTLPIHHLDSITTAADHGNPNGTSTAENHPAAAAKKDRHSKIHTARGPRDRRMRLSLDIARKFFDLQDLLGYDKASRTVDWLLRHSSAAIRDLARGRDGLQAITDQSCTSEDYGEAAVSSSTTAAAAKSRSSGRKGKRGGGGGVQQKRATVARESRRKARDRARERTSQKRRLMKENSAATAAAAAAAAAAAPTHNFAIYDAFQLEDLSSDEARMSGATTTEGVLCPWNSFNFHDPNNEFLLQDEQIAEFQFIDKPWEAYNSFNLSG